MPLSRSEKTQLDNLLNSGKTDEAAKLLAGVAARDITDAAAAAEVTKNKVPRTVVAVELDIFKAVHALLGNSPALVPLINEFEELITQPAAAEEPAK